MVGERLFASRIDGLQLKWDVMGKESSFDIVSVIDMQEVDNAINQAKKEAVNRYDLKKSSCVIDFERTANQLSLSAENAKLAILFRCFEHRTNIFGFRIPWNLAFSPENESPTLCTIFNKLLTVGFVFFYRTIHQHR